MRQMIMKGRLGIMLGVAFYVLISSRPALAQADGRFTGAVIDVSGALVPNATVTAKNEKTGEVRSTTTTPQGRYLIPNLKPSIYALRTEVKGFAPLEISGLALAV